VSRRSYAWGYKSRSDAADALDDLLSLCEVSMCEGPEISPYTARNVTTGAPIVRYQITLQS